VGDHAGILTAVSFAFFVHLEASAPNEEGGSPDRRLVFAANAKDDKGRATEQGVEPNVVDR
jgi:hypothetical protein